MVAYYFKDKMGLYAAVLESAFGAVLDEFRTLARSPAGDEPPVASFVRLYINSVAAAPWAPQLILREALLVDSPLRQRFVERYFAQMLAIVPAFLQREIDDQRLRSDLDPMLAFLSLASMAVFPYLTHPLTGDATGIALDENFRERLIEHTQRLFLDGARASGDAS